MTLLGGALVRSHSRFILFHWLVYLNFLGVALLLRYLFFPFQAVECLLRQTSASDLEIEATGVLLADSGPQANGPKEQLAHLSGINPVNQLSDDTAGFFAGIIKVDNTFSPNYELESDTSEPGLAPLSVKGRLKAHVQFWERINALSFITECIREG